MKSDVRIVLVGDAGCGKSSLINQAVSGRFSDTPPKVVPELDLPPDVTQHHVRLHIIDTNTDQRDQLEQQIRDANVICIVYSVTDQSTFDRLSSYWLPTIRKLRANLTESTVPTIIVGNKIDARKDENPELEKMVHPIMNEYKEVETCIECSAKTGENVVDLFNFAQTAVLFPTLVLFDPAAQKLKPAAVQALRRIFTLCDADRDELLNDNELNEFQNRCFGAPLQKDELERVKAVVEESSPDGIKNGGLTLFGFLFLHHLFIQKGKMETTWTVLRQFGYSDELTLEPSFLCPPINVEPDQTVELNDHGLKFFADLFAAIAKGKDVLDEADIAKLFEPSLEGNPWSKAEFTVVNRFQKLDLETYINLWHLTTSQNYKTTLKYLAYLGFPGEQTEAVEVTRGKKQELKRKRLSRKVLQVFTFGSSGSGKSALLQRIADPQSTISETYSATTSKKVAVKTFTAGKDEKTLVVVEFGSTNEKSVLATPDQLDACDLACLVFNCTDANSVEYVQRIHKQIKQSHDSLPCLFIGTKKDGSSKAAAVIDYCKANQLPEPVLLSLTNESPEPATTAMLNTALSPFAGTSESSGWGLKLGIGGAVLVGLGVAAWWFLGRKNKN